MTRLLLLFAMFLGATALSAQNSAPSDSIVVRTARNGLEIEGEMVICPGATTVLKVKGEYESYEWSTGQHTPAIPVFKPGTYDVTVTTKGGCRLTGSVTVRYSSSPCL
jgi:hypothetical protein